MSFQFPVWLRFFLLRFRKWDYVLFIYFWLTAKNKSLRTTTVNSQLRQNVKGENHPMFLLKGHL